MKRMWFRPDCVKWILEGKKTTTFRKRQHSGEYEIVEGSWFKPRRLGIFLKLTPQELPTQSFNIPFDREGDFETREDFYAWLEKNKLELPSVGYLHKIEVIKR